MFSSFLGLSCGKYTEISCHSCGHLTDSDEDFNYLGFGIHGAAVGLSHVVHLLCVELACAFFLERARLRGVLTARCIAPLLLQPVRTPARIRAGRYPAKHIPAARSNGAAPFFCPAQQLISGIFFRGYLLYTAHPILCRLL